MGVFDKFGLTNGGTKKEGIDTRIIGNAGLLVNEKLDVWYQHSSHKHGDVIDAWAYCKDIDRNSHFVEILDEMAKEVGIERSKNKKPNKTAVVSELLAGCEIFTGSNGVVYAKFQRDGHEEIANIRSAIFSGYLQSKFYAQTGSTV